MVRGTFVTAKICEFFVDRLCSGLWSVSFSVFPTSHPLFFFLPLFHQYDACLEWGVIAGLWGFTSHGSSILSRGWLATVVTKRNTREQRVTQGNTGKHRVTKGNTW